MKVGHREVRKGRAVSWGQGLVQSNHYTSQEDTNGRRGIENIGQKAAS